jgi:hypothetical protein
MSPEKSDPSVINTIQNMLSQGESEEKIIQTLKEIGVDEKQIKNLLMIAQADTFNLLKGEISKISKQGFDKELPIFKEEILNKVNEENKTSFTQLKSEFETSLDAKQNAFEQKQLKNSENLLSIVDNIKGSHDDIKNDISLLDTKIEEKTMGSTKGIRIMRIISFILGVIALAIILFKLITLGDATSIDFIIMYIITAAVSITLLILSLI